MASSRSRGAPSPRLTAPERELEQRLEYRFKRPELLQQALMHRSWRREQLEQRAAPHHPALDPEGSPAEVNAAAALSGDRASDADGDVGSDNERLEFLGDAVLGLRICERLVEAFPASSEGQMSRSRAWLVSARNLAAAARRLDLGAYLRLSRAEESIGGRNKQRLLANTMEAVIAAIQLDGGYGAAAEFIDRHVVGASLEGLRPGQLHEFAYKSALQEWAHAAGHAMPVYRVLSASGPEHEKVFTVEVALADDDFTAVAAASSKKGAEQKAAALALAHLGRLPPGSPPPD